MEHTVIIDADSYARLKTEVRRIVRRAAKNGGGAARAMDLANATARALGHKSTAALCAALRNTGKFDAAINAAAFSEALDELAITVPADSFEQAVKWALMPEAKVRVFATSEEYIEARKLTKPQVTDSIPDGYLTGPGQVVEFASDGKMALVRVIPYAGGPCLLPVMISGEGCADFAPALRDIGDLLCQDYWWHTPAYRRIAYSIGVNPDVGRPNHPLLSDDDLAAIDALWRSEFRNRHQQSETSDDSLSFSLWLVDAQRVATGVVIRYSEVRSVMNRALVIIKKGVPDRLRQHGDLLHRLCHAITTQPCQASDATTVVRIYEFDTGFSEVAFVNGHTTDNKEWVLDTPVSNLMDNCLVVIERESDGWCSFSEFVARELKMGGCVIVAKKDVEAKLLAERRRRKPGMFQRIRSLFGMVMP